jgi:peroxiredoxin Q/BCP
LKALGTFAARHTFYIGADGKILHIDRDVNVGSAGADIAARLEQLGVPQRGER